MSILSYLFNQAFKTFVNILLVTIKVIWSTIDKTDSSQNHNTPIDVVVIMYCIIILLYVSKL